jgi:hypothetical protein
MIDLLERQITEESGRSSVLDSAILLTRSQIDESKSPCRGYHTSDMKISNAEDRLHEIIVRFNHILSENTNLKDQIELLRKERYTHSSIFAKLKNELSDTVTRVAAIARTTESDNAARDSAISHFGKLKAQADREHLEFEREWKELVRLIENDRRMREFMEEKERRRLTNEHRRSQPVIESREDAPVVDGPRNQLETLHKKFEAIRLATGISTVQELISLFVETDKRNFSLFNRSNECAEAMHRLSDKLATIKSEMRSLGDVTQRSTRTVALYADENRRSRVESQADEINSKYSSMSKFLSSVRLAIQVLVENVFPTVHALEKYLSPAILIQNGASFADAITDSNLVFFLAAAESRINELVILYRNKMDAFKRNSSAAPTRSGQRKSLAAGISRTHHVPQYSGPLGLNKMTQFKLPSVTDDDPTEHSVHDEAEGILRVIPRDELVARTLAHIKKNQTRLVKK